MVVDRTQIGLTFPYKRQSREAQEAYLRAAGAQHIRHVDKTWTRHDAVKTVRPGDTVYIVALVMVATERGKDDLPPGGQPAEFLLEVHERGGTVIEVWTGRNSRDAKGRKAMVADAVRVLRGGGRKLPASGRKAGRPAKMFTPEALTHNQRCWFSKMYATNDVAQRHMLDGMTAREAWKLWGVSGRPFPSKRGRK